MDAAVALKANLAGTNTFTGQMYNISTSGNAFRHNRSSARDVSFGVNSTGYFNVYNEGGAVPMLDVAPDGSGISLGSWTVNPRFLRGTGFPNGAIAAPVGSIYIDTAITNGASTWVKKGGTGNTGWEVLEGRATNTVSLGGTAVLNCYRSSGMVTYTFSGTMGASVTNPVGAVADGYRPISAFSFLCGNGSAAYNKIATVATNGEICLFGSPTASATIAGSGAIQSTRTYPTV